MNIDQLLKAAWTERRNGNNEEVRRLLVRALQDCSSDDYNSLGRIYHIYGQLESDKDHFSAAIEQFRKSLMYYEKGGDVNKIAHSMRHNADLESELNNLSESEHLYRKAINLYRSFDVSEGDLANALRGFGLLLEKQNNTEEAIGVWKETKNLYQVCGLREGVDEAQNKLDSLL